MSKSNMLDPIIRAMVGVPAQFLGVILDLCNKLAGADGKLWYEKIRTALREGVAEVKEVAQKASLYLHLLPGAEALTLRACDGSRTIAQAKGVFQSYIDPDFTNWGLDVKGVATPAMPMQVHEQVQDGTFRQMFTSLSSDLDKLCLSQDQIVTFCEEHPERLRQDGCWTIFLFKKDDKFFVARVFVDSGGLRVDVCRFGHGFVWNAENRGRLVCPQLGPENLSV